MFVDDYRRTRPALVKLYEQTTASQWLADDLPWHLDVDPERVVREQQAQAGFVPGGPEYTDTPMERWGEAEWVRYGVESQGWTLSQFLHGEQGALVCTAQLVESVPWLDAKLFAGAQVADEARHVDVFARYLDDKLGGHYPVNPHLQALLDDIVADPRWDVTYLGMQIMVEGLALAGFGLLRQITTEPLLAELLRNVMADEARHVAFGLVSLGEVYAGLDAREIRDRQEFAFDATVRMRDRLLQQEVWARLGLDDRDAAVAARAAPERPVFESFLFSRIVPNCKRLGLLDAGDGWLRDRFGELGVVQYEDWE